MEFRDKMKDLEFRHKMNKGLEFRDKMNRSGRTLWTHCRAEFGKSGTSIEAAFGGLYESCEVKKVS